MSKTASGLTRTVKTLGDQAACDARVEHQAQTAEALARNWAWWQKRGFRFSARAEFERRRSRILGGNPGACR